MKENSGPSHLPFWYRSKDPLQSAVEYISSISPKFQWVGVYLLRGTVLELGPYIGAKTEHNRIPVGKGVCGRAVAENRDLNIADIHEETNYISCSLETQSELVVLIRDDKERILGQIDIDSHSKDAFGKEEEQQVRKVAAILGQTGSVLTS